MDFKEYYQSEKIKLEKLMNNYNENLLNEDNKLFKENLKMFVDLNSGGKLIRGVLVNFGYKLNSDDFDYSNNLALAYEIFHTSVLIHDDIIDNDNLRRGVKTIPYINYEKYKKYIYNEEELKNISNSIGILIADYGYYLSNKLISDSYKNDKNLGNILSYFSDIVLKTIKGEFIDATLTFENQYKKDEDENIEPYIMEIYKLKTAYYTIVGPICIGMLLSGLKEDKINDIVKFGEKVGIAYQIQDDILGIYSDETGKIIGSDIKEFKQTILYSYVINNSKEYSSKLLEYYGSNNLTNETVNIVRKIFEDSGAKDYSINLMNKLYDESLNELNSISWIKEADKKILIGFVEYLKGRNK